MWHICVAKRGFDHLCAFVSTGYNIVRSTAGDGFYRGTAFLRFAWKVIPISIYFRPTQGNAVSFGLLAASIIIMGN